MRALTAFGRQGAQQSVAGPAGLVTDADVSGSCGGRGAQRQLCGAATASRPRRDKAAWAGVGAAEAGKAEGGAGHPGPRLRTPASPRAASGPPSVWLARDERLWPPDRKEINAPQPPLPPQYLGPFLLPLSPGLRAEGRLTRRTGSLAQPRIPAFLRRSGLDPAEPQIAGGAGAPGGREARPAGSRAGDGSFLTS